MALKLPLCVAPAVVSAGHASIKGQRKSRLVMCANSHVSKSYHHLKVKNKMYEDAETGVVCYKDDETGEVTCEGYDEGPCFRHQELCDLRIKEDSIKEMLKRCWAQKGDEYKISNADKEMAVKKET